MSSKKTAEDIQIRLVEAEKPCKAKQVFGEEDWHFIRRPRRSNSASHSSCDNLNKITLNCQCCVAQILTGTDKCGQHVSQLWHIDPRVVYGASSFFKRVYRSNLRDFRSKTVSGTRTAGLAGGLYLLKSLCWRKADKEYRDMVNLVGSLTGEVLNIVTRVLTGPKVSGDGFTHVYFETKQRMAHVLQSLQPTAVAHQGFSYLDLPEEEERWNQDYNVNSKRWMDTLWKQYVDGEIDYDHMIKKIRE